MIVDKTLAAFTQFMTFSSQRDQSIVDSKSIHGRTALHEACKQHNPGLVSLLLNYGARVNAKDDQVGVRQLKGKQSTLTKMDYKLILLFWFYRNKRQSFTCFMAFRVREDA